MNAFRQTCELALASTHRLLSASLQDLQSAKVVLMHVMLTSFIPVHGIIGVYFWVFGVIEMAWFNAGSVAFYAGLALLARRYRISMDTLLLLIMAEVALHAMAADYCVGSSAGFAVYAVAASAMAPLFLSRAVLPWLLCLAILFGALFVGDALITLFPPLYALPEQVIHWTERINLLATMLILLVLAAGFESLVATAQQQIRHLADRDPLTSLTNRRAITRAGEHLLNRAESGSLCVAIADIDHFKRINDTWGHGTGDEVLCAVADQLRRHVRQHDHVARWGGEEFLWLMPATVLKDAVTVMDRLRDLIATETAGDPELPTTITVSVGIAQQAPGEGLQDTIARADSALYQSKQAGRNQVTGACAEPIAA